MNVERTLRLIAGAFVLASLGLGYWVSPYWFLFTAFVGLNLFQSGLTNWCPMMTFLRKCGVRDEPRWAYAPSGKGCGRPNPEQPLAHHAFERARGRSVEFFRDAPGEVSFAA